MKSVIKTASSSTLAVVTLLTAVACERPMEPTARIRPEGPRFATVVPADQPHPTYDAVLVGTDGTGRPIYELDQVCDIFIGEPVLEPVEDPLAPAHEWYDHQRVVTNVPEGAIVRLVANAQMGNSKTFVCDAIDRDAEGNPILDANGQVQPVIEPSTLHAAKGNAIVITTDGVTLDMNGFSATVYPSPFAGTTTDERFENTGFVIAGNNVTVTNSATPDAATLDAETGRPVGVSRIWGFGHNLEAEAEVSPTIRGKRFDVDGDPATADFLYNLETQGGLGVRLSGNALVEQVKSVNPDPVAGQGFEIRRCNPGSLSVIRDSHFEGGLEGAFIRECSGVTFENNYVSGGAGEGIVTKQAVSTLARPIIIRGNTVAMTSGEYGIVWGRDSRSNNSSLRIEKNKISGWTVCGLGVSNRNTTFAPYILSPESDLRSFASANTFVGTGTKTCRLGD